ncbi:hypothetical protein OGAPHI_007290 [Ogataea philodendri]|uniref:Protein yippee-like n=1 Tax=Ogataea philodendri TaxID=1378263 RepID=A0A9P8NV33_9ASCO|nr:uncharacterized protein OGAPHI_007290 [Ogataea philodendri]KAH3660085.1 hypothetical protein OGAPHI_007290 [Ogataea philodendri]
MGLVYAQHFRTSSAGQDAPTASRNSSIASRSSGSSGSVFNSPRSSVSSATSCPHLFATNTFVPTRILRCKQCHNHICLTSLIISDNFTGSLGAAFFVSKVLNVKLSKTRDFKRMKTGRYEVKGISCKQCDSTLGWKYLYSEEDKEKYKEGRFVVERKLLEEVDI